MDYRIPRATAEFGTNQLTSDGLALNNRVAEFGTNPAGLDVNMPSGPLGLRGMPANVPPQVLADDATALQTLQSFTPHTPAPAADTQAQIFYSPSTGNLVVNGFPFNQRDASAALASEEYARQPARQFTLPDTASDWRAMSPGEYASYLDTIRNPGFGRRISEAWESGWRGAGDVALGGGMAVAEATGNRWQWGERAHQNLVREFRENAPFMLGLSDIHDPGSALTYAAQMVVQGAPWVVETIASMAAGAAIGGAASGGVGAPAGAIEGFIAKEGLRRGLSAALRGTVRRGALAYEEALASSGARTLTRQEVIDSLASSTSRATADDVNRFFDFGERAFHLSRGAPASAGGAPLASLGAQTGSALSNYAMGVGDIHNSILDAGGDPRTANAIANIWGLAIPYAAIESLGDTVLTNPLTHLFPSLGGGPSRIGNALRHGALVGAGEGLEEGAQYGIDQQAVASTTNTPISIDPYDLLQNVVGGAISGAGIGGVFGAMEEPTPRITPPPAPSNGPTGPTASPMQAPGFDPGSLFTMETPQEPVAGLIDEQNYPMMDQLRQTPQAMTEQQYLEQAYNDPNATPEQRNAANEALIALRDNRTVNREAADRGAATVGRGVSDMQPPVDIGQPDLSVPITQQELAGLQAEAQQPIARNDIMMPPGIAERSRSDSQRLANMSANLRAGAAQRTPEDVFKDLAQHKEVSQADLIMLRTAVRDLSVKAPTNIGYHDLIIQLDHMIGQEQAPVNYDAAVSNLPNAPDTTTFERPPIRATGRGPGGVELGPDGLPKFGPHRLAPTITTEEANRRQAEANAARASIGTDGLRGRTETPAQPEDLIALAQSKATKQEQNRARNERRKNTRRRRQEAKSERLSGKSAKFSAYDQAQFDNETKKAIEATDRNLNESKRKEMEAEARKSVEEHARKTAEAEQSPKVNLLNKGKKDAVQERSTEEVPVREQPRSGERVRETHAQREEAPQPRQAEEKAQSVPQGSEIDQDRVERGYNALLSNTKRLLLKDPAQRISGLLLAIKKNKEIDPMGRSSWAFLDGKLLTKAELLAIGRKIKGSRFDKEHVAEQPVGQQAGLTKAEEAELRKLDEHINAMARPEDVTDAEIKRYNDLAIRAPKGFVLAGGRHITRARLEAEQKDIDREAASEDGFGNPLPETSPEDELAAARAEKKAARFGEDLSAAMKSNRTDPKFFKEFVLANIPEVTAWLQSADAKTRAGLRTAVEIVIRDNPKGPTVTRAATEELKLPETKLDMKGLDGRTRQRRVDYALVQRVLDALKTSGIIKESVMNKRIADAIEVLTKLAGHWPKPETHLRPKFRALRDELQAILNKRTGVVDKNKINVDEAKRLVKEVQSRIDSSIKFKTVHVFADIDDVLKRANDEVMIAPNGAEVTVARYLLGQAARYKLERPELQKFTDHQIATAFAKEMLDMRAGVINPYNALFVFADKIKDRRHLMQALEHELIVHNGLSAMFPDRLSRAMFLHRVAQIPGVEQKRLALIHSYPVYAQYTYLEQIEEVIAWHSEKGPLALEALMSAKEGVDKETRRSLWEDFKKLVMDWISRVFGDSMSTEDRALTAIVNALRAHAMLGTSNGDKFNNLLDALGAPQIEKSIEEEARATDRPVMAAAASTPEDTNKLLFGTPENPGRPYTPTPWLDQASETIMSNLPLMEKLKEIGNNNFGTSAKEALKKVGRNIEPTSNMALRSVLMQKLLRMMHNTIGVARSIMTKRQETRMYAIKSRHSAALRKMFGDNEPGATDTQRAAYGRLAIAATINKLAQTTEAVVRAAPRILVRGEDGIYTINRAVFENLLKQGTFSKEDFEKGIEQFVVTGDGKITSADIAKLPQDVIGAGYDIYVSETRHMAESQLEMLDGVITMLNQKNDVTVAKLIENNKIKSEDREFMNEMLSRMYKLYSDVAFHGYVGSSRRHRTRQADKARALLAELMRTMHTKEKVEDWLDSNKKRPGNNPRVKNDAFKWREQTDPDKDVAPFTSQINWFLGNDKATGLPRLERLNSIGIGKTPQYSMLGAFQGLLNSEKLVHEHENDTIQSVLGNYVEFSREGEWRVFLNLKDENGNTVNVNPELYAMLPVTYAKSEREAKTLMVQLAEELSGTFTINDDTGNPMKVTFDPGYEKAPGTSTLAEAPKLKEFLEVADLVGLNLSATQMKQIANLIENAANRKRFGLQRAGTPGMDANILRNNSVAMTRRAWYTAKMSQSWMMQDIFDDEKNLYGDWTLLKQLQDAFDMANRGALGDKPTPTGFVRNEAKVYLAETALLRYANQLRHMSKHTMSRPHVVIRTTKGEQKLKIEPEAQAHLDHAKALKQSLERNELEVNLNDLLSKTGGLRMFAVVAQLGSIASAMMNAFTIVTHLPWVLSAQHNKTGYGEGFTMSETMKEIMSAVMQVGKRLNMDESVNVKKLLDDARAGKNTTGLTIPELEFMYQETLDGLLAPQQTYSMTGGTESNITAIFWRNFSEAMLKPFGKIEAANRRVSALAAYRLARQRYIQAGVDPAKLDDITSDEYKKLVEDVQRVVYQSQGDYSNINRPKTFRGDIAQYFLMYKMFPLMTQIMIQNLPLAQQLSVLAVFFLLGGLKGEPFADDFADIYDTLLQKLGFRHDSVELQVTKMFEDILPGSSNILMHGFLDSNLFGGTISSRASMGDILPLTGILRPEADVGRELENAFGPAYSANKAAIEYAWLLTDMTMQFAGLKPQITSPEQLVRQFPLSQFRALGEAGLMAYTGQITDPQGRLTSDDVTMMSVFARALGFYPLEASKANNAVRLDRMHTAYMRNIRGGFVLAYANAYRSHDEARMNNIIQQVQEWNDAVEQTGQEDMRIRNFRSAATRAGRAASQTTVERTASGAPDYSVLEEMAGILNADTETDQE